MYKKCINPWEETVKKMEPCYSQWYSVNREETNYYTGNSAKTFVFYTYIIITVKVAKHWNRLLRKVLWSPFLEIHKTKLHTVLSNLLQAGHWTTESSEVPSSLSNSMKRYLAKFQDLHIMKDVRDGNNVFNSDGTLNPKIVPRCFTNTTMYETLHELLKCSQLWGEM